MITYDENETQSLLNCNKVIHRVQHVDNGGKYLRAKYIFSYLVTHSVAVAAVS